MPNLIHIYSQIYLIVNDYITCIHIVLEKYDSSEYTFGNMYLLKTTYRHRYSRCICQLSRYNRNLLDKLNQTYFLTATMCSCLNSWVSFPLALGRCQADKAEEDIKLQGRVLTILYIWVLIRRVALGPASTCQST